MKWLACILAVVALPALAQDVSKAGGAKLRLLDKLSGQVTDMVLADGQSQSFGRLTVRVDECRFFADNQTAEAFAHLTVTEKDVQDAVFDGWMIASSPALSAMDHPRYDVWVLRCDVPDLKLPDVVEDPAVDPDADPAATESGDGQ